MHRNTALLALLLSLSLPAVARADEPSADPAPVRHWYGWQALTVDLGSAATMAAGGLTLGPGGETLGILGGAGFAFGAPLIHLGHGHVGKALGSLALRTLVPAAAFVTGMFVGAAAAPSSGDGLADVADKLGGMAAGGFLGGISGGVLAAAIDDLAVAREDVVPVSPPPPDMHPTLEPRVSSVRGGAMLGIGGTF